MYDSQPLVQETLPGPHKYEAGMLDTFDVTDSRIPWKLFYQNTVTLRRVRLERPNGCSVFHVSTKK
jgi:hypothetical protein